jgi:hypothetical protein
MRAVGRVYTSGEPEMTTALQSYDASVYLRVAEARRCQINCAMFLPVFLSPARDRVAAVLEVSQTEDGALFAALLDWARCCLGNAGLCTTDADKDSLPVGLRVLRPELELTSALESGVGGRAGGGGARLGAASDAAAGSMPPPPRQQPAAAASAPPPPALPPLQPGSSAQAMTHNVEAGQRWQGASVEWEADDAAGGGSVTAGAAQAQQPQVQRQPQQQQQQPAVQANAQPQNVAPGCIVRVGNSLVFCADAGAVGGVGPAPPAGWEGARKGTKRPAAVASLSGPASRPTSLARTGSLPSGGAPSDSGAGTSLSPSLVAQRAASGHLPAASYGHGDRVVTLDDIRPHFGSSLKAAAAAMGVCVTTLKRACRRLGLPRWPRRELAKLTRDGGAAAAASTGSGQTISAGSSGELQQRQARPGPGAPVPQAGAARAPAPHAPAHAPSQTPAPQHQTQPPTPQMLALPVASAPAILGAMDAAPLDCASPRPARARPRPQLALLPAPGSLL